MDSPSPSNRTERVLRWAALAALLLALILVPFALLEQPMNEWSAASMNGDRQQALLAAATVLLLLADVLLPIPSSFVAAAAIGWLGPAAGGAAVWVGMTLAAFLGYAIGRFGGHGLVQRMVGAAELERAQRLMNRYGAWVLLLCRGVPVLAEASSLFVGATRLPFSRFLWVVALGNLGLAAAYATTHWFELDELGTVIAPFVLGILLPGLLLLGVRAISSRSSR
jgi:uncharacterized membrane protein YdjX (TVP38/TMEM64 family)